MASYSNVDYAHDDTGKALVAPLPAISFGYRKLDTLYCNGREGYNECIAGVEKKGACPHELDGFMIIYSKVNAFQSEF